MVLLRHYSYAQQGTVTINQDKNIETLLNLKKEMNKNTILIAIKFKFILEIRSEAETTQAEFNSAYSDWRSTISL